MTTSPAPFTTTTPVLAPLGLGQLRPTGWLRARLESQLSGMGGTLDEFWPDVRDSAWIGGSAEGWERGPYWLDAMVPLAFLTGDARLIQKVERWIDHILEHQTEDGWIGPIDGDPSDLHHADFGGFDVWPRMIALKALLQYESATGDERIVPAALRLVERIRQVLTRHPLHEWGRVRWADLVVSILALYERTTDPSLLEVAELVRSQGYAWDRYAQDFPYREKVTDAVLHGFRDASAGVWMNDDFLVTHGVNIAMGLKAMPVWWRVSGDPQLREAFSSMLEQLDRYHGQATGVFTSDEHLAGLNPSQGTETCTVVEYMFSLETALETWGLDEDVADRLERVAFNALPASARSDERGHQYDQQANQVICHVTEDRVYTNNGPESNTFGLAPHFGCCTANRHQGWSKFAARLWMRSDDGGLAALSYAPCEIDTVLGGIGIHVAVIGQYPFDDQVVIELAVDGEASFPLHLRIPAWARDAQIRIDADDPISPAPGSQLTLDRTWRGHHRITVAWDAEVEAHRRFGDAVTLTRGPIVFAAAVEEDWRVIGGEPPHESWEVLPAGDWNLALVRDGAASVPATELVRRPNGAEPFTPEGAPLRLEAVARPVAGWTLEHGAAAPPPASPVQADGERRMITMLPYGAARLRVTEIPWTLDG
ncbi:beta-L-arabinofuranosidase domain-containing protein [Microbacterium abyssi]|uniref:beta-L-arabinofuranosidase domain-containing protein n=1 Tax=Microbacterium abyssi TaxID=2782166 RepID=UPI001889A4E6|nr:beta-L-arabinofuranosidase domain-containing protein [Microbacterium sp. A18JL241]